MVRATVSVTFELCAACRNWLTMSLLGAVIDDEAIGRLAGV